MGTAIITGGTGGLGVALEEELRRAGMQVNALSRAQAPMDDLAALTSCFAALDTPDLLVCAAGITDDRLLLAMDQSSWDEVLDVNLRGAFGSARAVSAGMLKRRSGHIVFISSHAALHPQAGQAAYAAAKAALLGLTRSLAKEFGPRGVRVNAILPGFLVTRMTAGLPAAVLENARAAHVLGRFNTPGEVASFLRCLHFQMAGTSGQVFSLDSRVP